MTGVPRYRHILVTGASGGLGGALARRCAGPGVHLSLWVRVADRLSAVAQACRAAGASAEIRSLDITDIEATLAALAAGDEAQPVDLAFLASGRGDVRAPGDRVEDAALVASLGTVNFTAPAAMAAALAGRMAARGRGGVVLVGSAAAFHALPFAAAYCGSKAGLARFAEALRTGVRRQGVTVTLVSPGFIDTAAGRGVPGPKPLLMPPDAAAARIVRAGERGKAHAVMPWPFVLLRLLDRLLPSPLRERVLLSLNPPERAPPSRT
jgi:short-subunit dehydrogenase